jgi:hypothetical protein
MFALIWLFYTKSPFMFAVDLASVLYPLIIKLQHMCHKTTALKPDP